MTKIVRSYINKFQKRNRSGKDNFSLNLAKKEVDVLTENKIKVFPRVNSFWEGIHKVCTQLEIKHFLMSGNKYTVIIDLKHVKQTNRIERVNFWKQRFKQKCFL